jgi:hypothetical protein
MSARSRVAACGGMYQSARNSNASSTLPIEAKYRPRGMPITVVMTEPREVPRATGAKGNRSVGFNTIPPRLARSGVRQVLAARFSSREKVEHLVSRRVAEGITRKPEEDTLKKFLMIGALAFAATTVAQTATAAEFYVVRDATTKKCTVVDAKPTSTTTTVVDNGIYKTKTEAETGMKTTKVCTE